MNEHERCAEVEEGSQWINLERKNVAHGGIVHLLLGSETRDEKPPRPSLIKYPQMINRALWDNETHTNKRLREALAQPEDHSSCVLTLPLTSFVQQQRVRTLGTSE